MAQQTTARRNFLKRTTLAAASAWGIASTAKSGRAETVPRQERLPREVWIATISQDGMRARDSADMSAQMLEAMAQAATQQPDIICLPETFLVSNVNQTTPLAERAEEGVGEVAKPFADFARAHNCYVVCPIHTRQAGRIYNSAMFIDRQGKLLGNYHKLHPTIDEMNDGVSPGPSQVPVFETDFGKVGAQICFDIKWRDGWQQLADKGAEIVFWPSAFGGGAMLNAMAWEHQFGVVSSTWKSHSKICDFNGQELAKTSLWNRWACAPINLEKAFLPTWPYVARFDEIEAKYGRKVRIQNFADEEWSILESRSADIKIADILTEFDLKTMRDHLHQAELQQRNNR